MQTIGRRYHGPRFNYTDMCDYCGAFYHRSKMRLDSDQLLRCPQCMKGKTLYDLALEAQASVGYVEPVKGKTREGP